MIPELDQSRTDFEDVSMETYEDSSELEMSSEEQLGGEEVVHAVEITNFEVVAVDKVAAQKVEVTKIPRPATKVLPFKEVSTRDCGGDRKHSGDSLTSRRANFCRRKSLSLMEIQRFRSVGGSRSPKKMIRPGQESTPNLGAAPSSRGDIPCYERSALQLRNDFYCFVSDNEDGESDSKLAGMRVFASIMLNAWRRRRDEVRRLNEELNRVKKGSVKTKNQIHVISSLFKVEQKTNDDLSSRLRRVLEDQQKLQDMYNDLNKAYSAMQLKVNHTEQSLEDKAKEIEGLNYLLGESKTNLFKTMARERELETNLSNEQRKLMELENEKNELLSTIAQLKQCNLKKMELEASLEGKINEINYLKTQLDQLEKKLKDLKEKEAQVKEYEHLDMTQRKLIEDLTDRMRIMEKAASRTFKTQALCILRQFQKSTAQYSHYALHLLLPMTPAPSGLYLTAPPVLEKAMKICWS